MNSTFETRFEFYNPFREFAAVEKYWCELQARCSHHYFLSWGWISTWIKNLPESTDIRLVVGFMDDDPALAFFVGVSSKGRRILSLNATGFEKFDQLYLEYNHVLITPHHRFGLEELLQAVSTLSWDEFNMPGVDAEFARQTEILNPISDQEFVRAILLEKSSAPYVDLDKVRSHELDYLRLLSQNKRSQIRRSIKEYEKTGEINVAEAADKAQAHQYFEELVMLHQQEWHRRNKAGAFSNAFLLRFHTDLIDSRFDLGEIQIMKIFNPQMTIGILYNFVYRGKIYFYQSGFNYLPGNVYRPGLVSHYRAVIRNAERGFSTYEFMAGDADYKFSLSTDSRQMYWVKLLHSPFYYALDKCTQRIRHKKEAALRFLSAFWSAGKLL